MLIRIKGANSCIEVFYSLSVTNPDRKHSRMLSVKRIVAMVDPDKEQLLVDIVSPIYVRNNRWQLAYSF